MSCAPSWADFIDLAVMLDMLNRRILGRAIGEKMRAESCRRLGNRALKQRKRDGVIYRRDQGIAVGKVAPCNGARRVRGAAR